MSEENVELVRRTFEAWERGGLEAVLPLLSPEIEWHVRTDLLDSDVYRGHHGVRRLFASFLDVLGEIGAEPQEFIEAGDKVVVPLRWWGRGRASAALARDQRETWVYTLSEGKIVRIEEYPTREEALEAVGAH